MSRAGWCENLDKDQLKATYPAAIWTKFETLAAKEFLPEGQGNLPNLIVEKEPGPASGRVPNPGRAGFSEPDR